MAFAEFADRTVPSFATATLRWNWEARDVVRDSRSDPLWAARTYAIVSIAQEEAERLAASAAMDADGPDEPFVDLAIGAAAAMALTHLFPHEQPRLSATFRKHRDFLGETIDAPDAERARSIGETTAAAIIRSRASDGAFSLESAPPPAGAAAWYSSEEWAPLRTYWGRVRPFMVEDIAQFDAPPPPAAQSAEFVTAIDVVRAARAQAAAQNDALAKKWADGPGTPTPPGRWNKIAAELIARDGLGERKSVRILAALNRALADTSIACWHSKYRYWLSRPSQADGRIVPTYPLPNFPAYPSGHAAFSGAAAAFLSHVFTMDRQALNQMAEEAAMSRVVGGIHYPFDASAGLEQGRRIGEAAARIFEPVPSASRARVSVNKKLQSKGRRTR